MELRQAVEKRKIKNVWHFTRLSNLESILLEGLLPRSKLNERDKPPDFNDPYRHDKQINAICCSISFPNYKMLYSLRSNNPNIEWVILSIQPSVLWEKDCAFCIENAASSLVTCIPLSQRKDTEAFNKLFENAEGKPNRDSINLPDSYPTNPQAEVLIFGHVEPEYINGAVCLTKSLESRLKQNYPDVNFRHYPKLFKPRRDFEHW